MPMQSFTQTITGRLFALVAMVFWRFTGGCEESAERKPPPSEAKR